MVKKLNLRCLLTLASLLLLTACASKQITPQARQYYDNNLATIKKAPVSILADGCAIRSEVGTSHVVLDASERIASVLAEYLQGEAQSHGIQTQPIVQPQVCGGFLENPQQYQVAPTKGGERKEIDKLPLLASGKALSDKQGEIQKLLRAFIKAPSIVDTKEGEDAQAVKLDLSVEEGKILSDALKSDYVLITSAIGADISVGRSIGTAILQVAAGAAVGAAMGAVVYPVYYTVPQDATGAHFGIVHLSRQELIWKSSQLIGGSPLELKGVPPRLQNRPFAPLVAEPELKTTN